MLFALFALDKPGHLQVRLDTRPDHVAYLNDLSQKGILRFAGPLLDADGKPNGSLVSIEADSLDAAKAILAEDPYAKADLFASTDVRPWNWVFCKPDNA